MRNLFLLLFVLINFSSLAQKNVLTELFETRLGGRITEQAYHELGGMSGALVERAEGFATEDEWRRAYNEINEFENQIVDHGTLLLKFWLAISKEEQLERFQEREKSPYKHWKLTDEDWRNREQWDAYAQYAHDMIQYTSTSRSPWVLVEGDSKPCARLKVIKTVIDHLEEKLDEHA